MLPIWFSSELVFKYELELGLFSTFNLFEAGILGWESSDTSNDASVDKGFLLFVLSFSVLCSSSLLASELKDRLRQDVELEPGFAGQLTPSSCSLFTDPLPDLGLESKYYEI